MSMSMVTNNDKIARVLRKIGFENGTKITDTLQGSIWMAHSSPNTQMQSTALSNPPSAVIKVASQYLHNQKMAVVNNQIYKVNEDILMEKSILKFLTQNEECPDSIVKFIKFFKTNKNYYLMMENGGTSLFDFIQKAHLLISKDKIDIAEWHKMVKVIFKQMIESVEYIHSKNVCHFDISLENYLINDVQIEVDQRQNVEGRKNQIRFVTEDVTVKLCDFGLAKLFTKSECLSNKYCGKTAYKSPEVINKKKRFDAKKNDIWCLGVCLFMMVFGTSPFHKADKSDQAFSFIMNGHLRQLLAHWDKLQGVDHDLIDLFNVIFKYEQDRADLASIKRNKWLNNSN